MALSEDYKALQEKYKEVTKKLETSEEMQEHHRCTLLQVLNDRNTKKLEHSGVPMQGTQESNQLSLPLDKAKAIDEVKDNNGKEAENLTANCNCTPTFQDASMQIEGCEVEELKQKLDEAIKKKVHTQFELAQLEQVVKPEKGMLEDLTNSTWLAWAKRLQDKPSIVS